MKKIILLLSAFSTLNLFAADQVFNLSVTEKGFEPNSLKVKTTSPVVLKVTRKTDSTCATQLVIPSKNIKVDLPLNKEVLIKVGTLSKGEVKFGCAMEMMIGAVMNVE
jgi:plastocyanin domain-containing protein